MLAMTVQTILAAALETWILAALAVLVVLLAAACLLLVLRGARRGPAEDLLGRLDALRSDLGSLQADLAKNIAESSGDLRERVVERLAAGFDNVQQRIAENLTRGRQEQLDQLDKAIEALQKRFEQLQQATEKKLGEIRGEVEKKLSETVQQNLKSFSEVAGKLTQLHEAAGQMVSLSQNVGELKTILQSPKARGAFGEMTLEQMLAEMFGTETDLFATQYEIEDGQRVDAVIFVEPGRKCMVCIDSKFPLENAQPLLDGRLDEQQAKRIERDFARDVQARAQEIAERYIRPPKTLDFAFMFVPAESVYYLLLRNGDLHRKLLQMRVVPTSPNAFYAYLRALAYAFRGRKLQQQARALQKLIEQIARDFERFAEDFRLLGRHIDNAKSRYDQAVRDVDRFKDRIAGIQRIEVSDAEDAARLADDAENASG